jgi:hypothetical protein
MKKQTRLFSLLIVLLLHFIIFFIIQSSMPIVPIASTITQVTLLDILSEPIPPKAKTAPIAFVAKSTSSISKNSEVANFAQKTITPNNPASARSRPVNAENKTINSKPTPSDEPIISGLDTALSGTASTVATLPKGFSDKKIIAGLKSEFTEKRTALAKEMEKAVRPDCKTAYQNLGIIIAPLALLHDTVRDKGCQW